MLRKTGFPEIADEALRVLPDPVDEDQIAAFLAPYAALLVDNVNRLHDAESFHILKPASTEVESRGPGLIRSRGRAAFRSSPSEPGGR